MNRSDLISEFAALLATHLAAELQQQQGGKSNGQATYEPIGYTESDAADLLGVPTHVLRDARQRGEISARKVGRRFIYSRRRLEEWLQQAEGDA